MGEKGLFEIPHLPAGKAVRTKTLPRGFGLSPDDPDHAVNPKTGQKATWDDDGLFWVDEKGEPLQPAKPAEQPFSKQGRQRLMPEDFGFSSPDDIEHAVNPKTGQKAVWNDDLPGWVDEKTGDPIHIKPVR